MKPVYAFRRLFRAAVLLSCLFTSSAVLAQSVSNVTRSTSFSTIQAAINDAQTQAGDMILVGAGTYMEDVIVSKGVHIAGADPQTVIVAGPAGGSGSTFSITASNVVLEKMTVTRIGNNVITWNDPTLNTAGISIQGLTVLNAEIRYMNITGNRTGIDINHSGAHNIHHNYISNNRIGMIFRNQTDNILVNYNVISDNWALGVLFLDASGGTNSPLQQSSGSLFAGNTISNNWYGDIVDRQTGGSLPAPGSNGKNFLCTTFGTTTPTVTTSNSAEPGYAAQIPVAYGGTATSPGGQPNIAGAASANILYTVAPAVTISYPGTPYCGTTGTVAVTQTGPTSGFVYSAQPAGLALNPSTGAIDLAASQPGTYAVGYSDGCSFAGTFVTIRPSVVSSIPNGSYCAGAAAPAISLGSTAGITYTWTNSNPAIGLAASGTGDIPSYVTTNSGTDPIMGDITVTASGGEGCFSRMVFRNTVRPVPALSSLSNVTRCAGVATGNVNFVSSISGTTVSWTNNNSLTGLAAAGTGNIPSYLAVNNSGSTQVSTISATPTVGGCTGSTSTMTLTVHPAVTSISYPQQTYCQANWAYATRNGSAGGTWSATPAGLSIDPGTGAVNLGTSTPGSYTITYAVASAGGCSSSASTSMTVNPQASVNAISNQTFCAGNIVGAINFTGSAATYNWTNDNPAIGLAASGSGNMLPSFTATNPGPGDISAYIRVTPQGNGSTLCPNKPMAFRITVEVCPPVAGLGDTGGDAATLRSQLQQSFQVGPNPARSNVLLQYSGSEQGPFSVQVLTQWGTALGRGTTFTGSAATLDVSGLTPGSYLLQVTHIRSGVSFNKQLIKL